MVKKFFLRQDMKKFFATTWLCLFIHHAVFGIVSFEEGMQPGFSLSAYPKAFLLQQSYDRNNYAVAKVSEHPKIPKIIHQIWIGGELPDRFKKFVETWKIKHPDWTYRLWTDGDIESFEFSNKQVFDAATNKGTKADIWRYEILCKYGGVYLDTDYECIKPLDVLHHTCEFYVCADYDCVGNGVIGCVPNHPIIKKCINGIKLLSWDNLQSPWKYTGPGLITKCINSYLMKTNHRSMGNVAVYPSLFFHPFPGALRFQYWSGELSRNEIERFLIPETFAVHFWAESWVK